jgi:hypothetical protein
MKTTSLKPRDQTRVKRYRANHRRIDYAPGPDALAIIKKRLRTNPNNYSLQGVIDDLVQAGDSVISGNGH